MKFAKFLRAPFFTEYIWVIASMENSFSSISCCIDVVLHKRAFRSKVIRTFFEAENFIHCIRIFTGTFCAALLQAIGTFLGGFLISYPF